MGWHRGYWGGWHINHRGGFWVLVCLGWFWGLATAGVALAQEEVLGALEQALENFVAENFEAAESAERQAEQKALIERALIATDGATGWETPQRRRASKILLNLGTQALADGFYSHSERLLLRAQSLIPVGNAGLRQDAKTRAGLFTAFGKLYLARQDWAQAEFWLAQAEDQIKEAGFADEVASNVYAYEVAFWQGRVLLGRAQEAEAEVARDLAGQAVAKLRALYQDTEEKLRQESLDSVVNHLRLLQIRNALAEASAVLGRLQEQAGEDSAKALAEAQSLWNATLREATEKEQVPPRPASRRPRRFGGNGFDPWATARCPRRHRPRPIFARTRNTGLASPSPYLGFARAGAFGVAGFYGCCPRFYPCRTAVVAP